MKTDGTMSVTDKIIKNQQEIKKMLVTLAEGMLSVEETHKQTLKTICLMAEYMKTINEKINKGVTNESNK